ncbi:MAG: YggT family protein [Clostridium sp.]
MIRWTVLTIIRVVEIAILINVLSSWIPNSKGTKIVQITEIICEPLLGPVRAMFLKVFPNMMIDFSPIVVILILDFIRMGFSTF